MTNRIKNLKESEELSSNKCNEKKKIRTKKLVPVTNCNAGILEESSSCIQKSSLVQVSIKQNTTCLRNMENEDNCFSNSSNTIQKKKSKYKKKQLTEVALTNETTEVKPTFTKKNKRRSSVSSTARNPKDSRSSLDKCNCIIPAQVKETQSPPISKKRNKKGNVTGITQVQNGKTLDNCIQKLNELTERIERIENFDRNHFKIKGIPESQVKAAYYVLRVMINVYPTDSNQNASNDKQIKYYQKLVSMTNISNKTKTSKKRHEKLKQDNKYVALDCEMVGAGYDGRKDLLARVSIVNKSGRVLLDKYVKPTKKVTDYRTHVSGIRPHNIANGYDFYEVQTQVLRLLKGNFLIGHSLQKDLAVLRISHPKEKIRDTATFNPLCSLISNRGTPSLKSICKYILDKEIQIGEHNSVEDARAVMGIYNVLSETWELYLKSGH